MPKGTFTDVLTGGGELTADLRRSIAAHIENLEGRFPGGEEQWSRTPAHSTEAEQGVLGSMLMYPICEGVFAILQPGDFYREQHKRIAESMLRLVKRGQPVDLTTVSAELRSLDILEDVGGALYLTSLLGEVPTAAHAPTYAKMVRDLSVIRDITVQCREWCIETLHDARDPREMTRRIQEATSGWESRVRSRGTVTHMSQLADTEEKLLSFVEAQANWESVRPHFGIGTLDEYMRGMPTPGLTVAKGQSSSGKSTLCNQAIYHWTHGHDQHAAIASNEMALVEQTMPRLIRMHTGIDINRINVGADGKLPESVAADIRASHGDILKANCTHINAVGMTGADILSQVRQIHREKPLTLAVVDYLQNINAAGVGKEQAFTQFAQDFKNLSHELGIAALLMSQVTVREDGIETEKWSTTVGDVADAVISIQRKGKTLADRRSDPNAQIVLEKNRNGPVGKFEVLLQPDTLMWVAVSDRTDEPTGYEVNRDARDF